MGASTAFGDVALSSWALQEKQSLLRKLLLFVSHQIISGRLQTSHCFL